MSKKVLLIIAAEGFQPVEYGVTKKILTDAGVEVATASDASGQATSATGEEIQADRVVSEVQAGDYDGIFLIGGPGALEHLDNEDTYRLIREVAGSDKAWGAICISPRILAKAGLLRNRKVTGWDGDHVLAEILEAAGAEYVRQPVVVDGRLITANGPSAAEEFGKEILEMLSS